MRSSRLEFSVSRDVGLDCCNSRLWWRESRHNPPAVKAFNQVESKLRSITAGFDHCRDVFWSSGRKLNAVPGFCSLPEKPTPIKTTRLWSQCTQWTRTGFDHAVPVLCSLPEKPTPIKTTRLWSQCTQWTRTGFDRFLPITSLLQENESVNSVRRRISGSA